MRRRSALLAVPALLLTAAGCGSDKKSNPASSTSPSAAPSTSTPPAKIVDGPVPAITGGTKFGQKPTVAKGSGTPSTDLAVKTVTAGTGPAIAKGDYAQVNYLGQIWKTGKVFDNSYDRHATYVTQIGAGAVIPGWDHGLVGKKVGSRIELALPPSEGYGYGRPGAGRHQGHRHPGLRGRPGRPLRRHQLRTGQEGPADQREPAQGRHQHRRQGRLHRRSPRARRRPSWCPSTSSRATARPSRPPTPCCSSTRACCGRAARSFDATYTKKALANLPLGQLDQGLAGGPGRQEGRQPRHAGDPAGALGYGAQGQPPTIPANATLVFSLDILAAS